MKRKIERPKPRSGLVAALDVGTTKICCLIAKPDGGANDGPRIVGIGHQVSRGLRSGIVVDLDAAEAALRATVEAAEQMAGGNIRQVTINVSGAGLASRLIAYEIEIAGHPIGDADLRRVLDPAVTLAEKPAEHELVHTLPVGYAIDGNRGVRDPRGLCGQRLGVNLHLLSTPTAPLRNLMAAIARCHLEVDSPVVAPYASALSCLVADEVQLGVTVIDMGGGTTSVAVFFDGELVHAGCVPVGGVHITSDIARGLSTPLAQAERLKTLHGTALPSPSDEREMVSVPLIGEDGATDPQQVPRSMLVGIIRPRIEETFELVRAHLAQTGFDKVAGRRVVLTGGASQLPGVREVAGQILDRQIRFGKPKGFEGLAEAASGPAFSTACGLLAFALERPEAQQGSVVRPGEAPPGRFGRIGQWLRENF